MPLYRTQSPYQAAVGALGNASQTASSMTKKTETKYNEPSKSLGGAIAAGIGGAIGGMGVAEQFDEGTSKAFYDKMMGSLFGTPENAAGALAGDMTMTGAGAAGDALSMTPSLASGLTSGLPAAQSLTGGAGTLGSMGAGAAGIAGTSGLLGAGAGLAGSGSLSGMAGLGTGGALATDLGVSGGLAAADLSLSGAAGLGTSASMAEGAKLGAAGGWTGAAIGAGLGLTLGLASYFF